MDEFDELVEAASKGQHDIVARCLRTRRTLALGSGFWKALQLAIKNSDEQMVALLLAHRDCYGRSALHYISMLQSKGIRNCD